MLRRRPRRRALSCAGRFALSKHGAHLPPLFELKPTPGSPWRVAGSRVCRPGPGRGWPRAPAISLAIPWGVCEHVGASRPTLSIGPPNVALSTCCQAWPSRVPGLGRDAWLPRTGTAETLAASPDALCKLEPRQVLPCGACGGAARQPGGGGGPQGITVLTPDAPRTPVLCGTSDMLAPVAARMTDGPGRRPGGG